MYFINEGIKKLRHVEATTPAGMQPRTLYRGVHGLSLTEGFMMEGGTEFACMSTSASLDIAAKFAAQGQKPLVFKYDTSHDVSLADSEAGWLNCNTDGFEELAEPTYGDGAAGEPENLFAAVVTAVGE